MVPELTEFLSQFPEFSEEDIVGIAEDLPVKVYEKGDYLLKEGSSNEFCYFILAGCARQFEQLDGEEKTVAFYTENEAVIVSNVKDDNTSGCYVEAVERVVSIKGRTDNSDNMFGKFPKLQSAVMKMMQQFLTQTKLDFTTFVGASPEEKYKKLLELKPEFFQRFPQHQIASFLGMKPETLSRIKKRVLSK